MKTAIIYKVYILPHEKYCGVTRRNLSKRLWEHNKKGRNIKDAEIIAWFSDKKEAYDFETKYQLDNNFKGYIFNENWRTIQSNKCLKDKPSDNLKRKVQCIETGFIYDGIREFERSLSNSSGNLTKHLQGHEKHKTFHKLTFRYYE